jgi:hypothetical protein
MIDLDCDGYGVGSPNGPDADDSDPAVNDAGSMLAKYRSVREYLMSVKKYNPHNLIFIANDGSDHGCAANNEAKPCASFNKAIGMAGPGDAVIWRGGTYLYSKVLEMKGGRSPAAPSIYMNYPGEKVTLEWNVNSDGFALDGRSNWIIDGLILKSTAQAGAALHGIQPGPVSNMIVRQVETIGWYDGLYLQNGLNKLTIENSSIHDSRGEHNAYLGCSTQICPDLVIRGSLFYHTSGGHNIHINGRFPNARIESNLLYGNAGDCLGLQMGVSGSTIQNNVCFTVVSAAIWLIDYFQNTNPSIQCYDQNNNVIRYNTFIADGRSYSAIAGGNDGSEPVYRVTDQCAQNRGSHDLGHNTFEGNIFVHWCSSSAVCPSGSGPVLMYDGPASVDWLKSDTWKNNVLFNIGSPAAIAQVNGALHDWKWFTDGKSVPLAAGNVNVDPKFTAADPAWSKSGASWNLVPMDGSPAIGLIRRGSGVPLDIRGQPRNDPTTAGAYESAKRLGLISPKPQSSRPVE